MIYLIGSLRNPKVPEVAKRLREEGHEVFDDWFSAGEFADDYWRDYEKARGHNLKQALEGWAAQHVFEFDTTHLKRADTRVMVMPAGKSCHLELGWGLGQGKRGYILFDEEPERFDFMLLFATGVFYSLDDLVGELKNGRRGDEGDRSDYRWGEGVKARNVFVNSKRGLVGTGRTLWQRLQEVCKSKLGAWL